MIDTLSTTGTPMPAPSREPHAKDDVKALDTAANRRAQFRRKLKERQTDNQQSLAEFLLARRKHYRTLDRDARNKHLQDIDLMCRYFNGDQYGEYNEAGVYTADVIREGDYAYTIPVITGHVEQAMMMLLKTVIEYELSANDRAESDGKALARMCEELAIEDKNRLLNEDALQDEILNTVLAGESHRCLIWGVNPDSPKIVKRLKYNEQHTEIAARRECEACKADVANGLVECSECGSTFITDIPPAQVTKLVPAGEEEVRLGENMLHIPHPMSVQRDMGAAKLKHSTFIIERDYLAHHVAEWMYQTSIPTSTESLSPEISMRQELERSSIQTDSIVGSAQGGVSPSHTQQGKVVERERVFMDVAEYGHFYLHKEETLPDGRKIVAGKLLGDVFPDGLFVVYLNDTIISMKGVNKNRRWSIVQYGKRPGTSKGAGLQLLIPMNDIINDSFNLEYSIGMRGHPFTILNRQFAKELPEAGQFLFVDKLPAGANIDSVARRFPGEQPSGFLSNVSARIDGAMQFIGGTYSMMGTVGAPDQRAMGTATAVASANENAAGRMLAPIKQRAFADKELIYQILENIRDYSSPEQKEELAKRFGSDVSEMFFECNFRQSISIAIAKNTDTPRSLALTQARMAEFGQIAGALSQSQAPWVPDLLAEIADALSIPFNVGEGRSDRREAEYRLNKLMAINERIREKHSNTVTDAQELAETMYAKLEEFCKPLIDPFMHDHTAFMDVYKDWLFGERAKTASEAARLVVVQLWMEHFKAKIGMELEAAKLQKEIADEINPPPEPPMPDPAQVAAQQDEQDQRRLLEATVEHETAEEAKDNDLERDIARREHDAEMRLLTEGARQAR